MTPQEKAVIRAAKEWNDKAFTRNGSCHPEDMKLSSAVHDLKDREGRK